MVTASPLQFVLPSDRIASSPPEARGLRRDLVRLLVADSQGVTHTRFDHLGDYLSPGDLLVVNTSQTMPAAVRGTIDGGAVGVHFSSLHEDGNWSIELRQPDNTGPILDRDSGDTVALPSGRLTLLHAESGQEPGAVRLWRARVDMQGSVRRFLRRHGKPIRYSYVPGEWPLSAYQTVFADYCTWPASSEMASAARPFTKRLVADLRHAGVLIAPISLHAGVSSLEAHEPPRPEPYVVPRETADAVNAARSTGQRVIAVGTTVTRALETVASPDGIVQSGQGWTELILGPDRPARAIDGLITGWHAPEASHLQLLGSVVGPDMVGNAYEAALESDYEWHELGDSSLLIRDPNS